MKIFILPIVILFGGCILVPDMTSSRNILKSVNIGASEVEWFSVSSSYVEAPDYIILRKGRDVDTICRSSNIADIKSVGNDTLIVGFYNSPQKNLKYIELPKAVRGYIIVIDTTYIRKYKQ